MKTTIGFLFAALVAAVPASAHHAFAVEFDAKNCADISGILTKVDYQNPHAYIYVDAKGVMKTFQLSSTSNLKRGGATLPVMNQSLGKEVVVRGCASRNGEDNRYAASFIKLADGTVQRLGQDVEGIFGTKIWR